MVILADSDITTKLKTSPEMNIDRAQLLEEEDTFNVDEVFEIDRKKGGRAGCR